MMQAGAAGTCCADDATGDGARAMRWRKLGATAALLLGTARKPHPTTTNLATTVGSYFEAELCRMGDAGPRPVKPSLAGLSGRVSGQCLGSNFQVLT